MLRIFASLTRFAAVVAAGFDLHGRDLDGAQCDQACAAESAEEVQSIMMRCRLAWPRGDTIMAVTSCFH
jgi:hypothetical protein